MKREKIKEEHGDTIEAVLDEWLSAAKERLEKEEDFVQQMILNDKIQEVEEILEVYFA